MTFVWYPRRSPCQFFLMAYLRETAGYLSGHVTGRHHGSSPPQLFLVSELYSCVNDRLPLSPLSPTSNARPGLIQLPETADSPPIPLSLSPAPRYANETLKSFTPKQSFAATASEYPFLHPPRFFLCDGYFQRLEQGSPPPSPRISCCSFPASLRTLSG